MSERLFFALWPDAAAVRALSAWAGQAHALCGGRVMLPDDLHLTMAFLGEVEKPRIPELQALLCNAQWSSGPLCIDRYGYFHGPRIVWAGPSSTAHWLQDLHLWLWRQLEPAGFRPDDDFRPHLSLLRRAQIRNLADLPRPAPVCWVPDDFRLIASRPGSNGSSYRTLARAPRPANS